MPVRNVHNLATQVRNGHIKRITDNDIQSSVLEVEGSNVRYVRLLLSQKHPLISHLVVSTVTQSPVSFPFYCSTTYITCPADPKKTLGIKLPFLVMIIKNLKKYFTFEVQVGSATTYDHHTI